MEGSFFRGNAVKTALFRRVFIKKTDHIPAF